MKHSIFTLSALSLACAAAPAIAQNTSNKPETNSKLETVVVVSSKQETPLRELATSVAVLDEIQIETLGYTSLADTLRTLPSVSVSNSGGQGKATTLRVRGEAGYRTLVQVDGVDVSDPTGTQSGAQIQHIMSGDIGRVELLRGPQGLMYGADAGGVLNISTRQQQDGYKTTLSGEAGRYGSQRSAISTSGANQHVDYFVSYNHASTDGFNTSLRDVALQDDDGYSNKTIHARVGINLSDSLRLDAVARNTESDNEYDDCGGALKDVCTGTFDQEVRRVALSHSLDWLDNSIAYSSSEVDRDNFTAGVSSYATEGEIEKLEWNGRVRFNDAHALAYGLEDRTDRVLDNERDQDAGFLEYQGRYGDSIFITAGARQDDNEDFGKFETYRVSGAYVVGVESGDVKFKTSYGTGFRAPSLYEIDYNRQQNDPTLPQLAPEESTGVDVGVEYFANNGLYLEAVLFKQTVESELGWVSVSGSPFWGYYGQGTGESKSQGVELSLATPLTEQLHLNANYTYVDAETVTGLPRARVPEHLANLGLSYEPNDAWQFAVNVRASAGAKETNGKKLDDYQLLDASVRYIASPMLSFHLRGENLTNKDYVEVANYRTAKSAIYGGVKIDF